MIGFRFAIDTGMGDDDDTTSGFCRARRSATADWSAAGPATKKYPAVILRFFPHRNRRRSNADDSDFYAIDVFHDVGLEGFPAALRMVFVLAETMEIELPIELCPGSEPVIVLVIAHGHSVILQIIHGEHHRIRGERPYHRISGSTAISLGHVVLINTLERGALDRISAIDKQR